VVSVVTDAFSFGCGLLLHPTVAKNATMRTILRTSLIM
jgi:cytochrome bd-type quinol oxidase subunit 2